MHSYQTKNNIKHSEIYPADHNDLLRVLQTHQSENTWLL